VCVNSSTFAAEIIIKKDNVMVVLFMITFIVAVCAAEALRANNGMNLGMK